MRANAPTVRTRLCLSRMIRRIVNDGNHSPESRWSKPLPPRSLHLRTVAMLVLGLGIATVVIMALAQLHSEAQSDSSSIHSGSETQPANPAKSAEEEVIDNILSQRVGSRTLADDQLPREFLQRIANRIICESFEEDFRIVVDDAGAAVQPTVSPSRDGNSSAVQPDDLRILENRLAVDSIAYRKSLPEARPALRGFRAPILEHAAQRNPIDEPNAAAPQELSRMVGGRLARDGLLRTLRLVIEHYGAEQFMGDNQVEPNELLLRIGFPVDWLEHFELSTGERGIGIARAFATTAATNRDEAIESLVKSAKFECQPTQPGFRVATESGEGGIQLVRAQLTRGDHWLNERDGGNLHMLQQMVQRLSTAKFVASVEEKHVPRLRESLHAWSAQDRARLTIVPELMTVSQWAQDNGKPGTIDDESGNGEFATLVPRFASRGDDGSTFVPGETFLADGLHAAGCNVVQSPLLFQGGNLLAIEHPSTHERILLIGEAEIYRNTALGLTEAQVLEAFRVEFGVDRVHRLPSTSFHLDFDVTIRACGEELVAFINDDEAAARVMLQCGVEALERAGRVDPEFTEKVRKAIGTQDREKVFRAVWPVAGQGYSHGRFPLSFAESFSGGPEDSGIGNLHRFWLALDLIKSYGSNPAAIRDQNLRTYYDALRRLRDQRDALHHALSELGMKLVAIPSVAHGARGINYLNGIHAPGIYLMPAYGGIYASLDQAAKTAFEKEFGESVQVIPIFSAESQRRLGAVHCSFAVYSGR